MITNHCGQSASYGLSDRNEETKMNGGEFWEQLSPGGRLNKKDGLTRYGNSHVKDKTS